MLPWNWKWRRLVVAGLLSVGLLTFILGPYVVRFLLFPNLVDAIVVIAAVAFLAVTAWVNLRSKER